MKIIALSGKKQSGKNTSANFLLGLQLQQLGLVENFDLTNKGELFLFDLMGQEANGVFSLNNTHTEFIDFLHEHVYPYIKLYSFADILKQNICIATLGLTYNQCYGTDKDKNSYTHLLWENIPVTTTKTNTSTPKSGPMTAREVLQYIGTNIFRQIYSNVWVDATIRHIKKDDPVYAIITDCRFPNEVQGVHQNNGIVIRHTRDLYKSTDKHTSETALDKDHFNWANFDIIINNENMSIKEQCNFLAKLKII